MRYKSNILSVILCFLTLNGLILSYLNLNGSLLQAENGKQREINPLQGELENLPDSILKARQYCNGLLKQGPLKAKVEGTLPEGIAILEVRNGKVRQHHGEPFDKELGNDWSKHFFMGLKLGGKAFESKAHYLFHDPRSKEDFLKTQGSWNLLRRLNLLYSYRLVEQGKSFVFALIDHQKVTVRPVTDRNINQKRSRLQSLGIQAMLLLLSILIAQWRYLDLLFQSLRFRLSFLWIIFIMILGNLFYPILESGVSQVLKSEARRQQVNTWRKMLVSWEQSHKQFEANSLAAIRQDFLRESKQGNLPKLPNTLCFQAYPNGLLRTQPDSVNPFQSSVLAVVSPLILSRELLGESRLETTEDLLFAKDLLKKFQAHDHLNLHSEQFMYMRDLSRRMIEGELGTFGALGMEKFLFSHFMNRSKKSLSISGYLVSKAQLSRVFLKDSGLSLGSDKLGSAFWSDFEMESQMQQDLSIQNFENNSSSNIVYDSVYYFQLQLQSPYFQGRRFTFLTPQKKLYASLEYSLAQLRRSAFILLILSLVFYLLFILAIQIDLLRLKTLIHALRNSDYQKVTTGLLGNEISSLIKSASSVGNSLEEKEKMQPFLATKLIQLFQSVKSEQKLIQDSAVVLFSDIRSFTTLSEQHSAKELVELLNEYFTLWEEAAQSKDGFIEKFIGDAVVAVFFGADKVIRQQLALETAIQVMSSLHEFNKARGEQGKFTIQIGIGLSVGPLNFGIIGDKRKSHFLAIGDPVQNAEELETATKAGQFTGIFIDSVLHDQLKYSYDFEMHELESGLAWELKSLE